MFWWESRLIVGAMCLWFELNFIIVGDLPVFLPCILDIIAYYFILLMLILLLLSGLNSGPSDPRTWIVPLGHSAHDFWWSIQDLYHTNLTPGNQTLPSAETWIGPWFAFNSAPTIVWNFPPPPRTVYRLHPGVRVKVASLTYLLTQFSSALYTRNGHRIWETRFTILCDDCAHDILHLII